MRRVFGTDNLQAIIDDDTNAAGDYAVNMLIPIQMVRSQYCPSKVKEKLISALYYCKNFI